MLLGLTDKTIMSSGPNNIGSDSPIKPKCYWVWLWSLIQSLLALVVKSDSIVLGPTNKIIGSRGPYQSTVMFYFVFLFLLWMFNVGWM
jgi:hypothetical protein